MRSCVVTSVQGCVVVDQQCIGSIGSNGKVKIEGYMSISDEEAHHCVIIGFFVNFGIDSSGFARHNRRC